jgi:hypothetical protein
VPEPHRHTREKAKKHPYPLTARKVYSYDFFLSNVSFHEAKSPFT